MVEIWKDISGYEGIYQVSNLGRIKALEKHIHYIDDRVRYYQEKVLKPRLDGKGYPFVTLYNDNKKEQLRVHRLVAIQFLENKDSKLCVNHKDSDRTNNIVDNLEWSTHKENTEHGIRVGYVYKPGRKISEEDVIEIRTIWETKNKSQREIGETFGLKQAQISRIVNNKNWIK